MKYIRFVNSIINIVPINRITSFDYVIIFINRKTVSIGSNTDTHTHTSIPFEWKTTALTTEKIIIFQDDNLKIDKISKMLVLCMFEVRRFEAYDEKIKQK